LDSGLDQPILHAILLVLKLPTEYWRWYLNQGGEIKQYLGEKVGSLTSNNSLIVRVHLKNLKIRGEGQHKIKRYKYEMK
jgi:hypothetical protein